MEGMACLTCSTVSEFKCIRPNNWNLSSLPHKISDVLSVYMRNETVGWPLRFYKELEKALLDLSEEELRKLQILKSFQKGKEEIRN